MSRWEYLLALLIGFFNRLHDEIKLYRRTQSQQRLDNDAADIDDDPYGYAVRQYGGRLPDDAKTDAAATDEAAR